MPAGLIAVLLQGILQYGPGWYKAAVEIIHNPNPTKDDFLALLQFATQQSYDDYIAAARAKVATA